MDRGATAFIAVGCFSIARAEKKKKNSFRDKVFVFCSCTFWTEKNVGRSPQSQEIKKKVVDNG